jgi:iron complex outermembrane recepter protein
LGITTLNSLKHITYANAIVFGLLATASLNAAERAVPQEIVVTESRTAVSFLDLTGNTALLDRQEITTTNAIHPYELGVRVPGVWISRGSGQEHLTAIRSAVLTGAGSCGAFLVLENSVPTRPTGFCNVNQLLEIPVDLANNIEVIRGPAGALYGSNGLHGTINILLPQPGSQPGLTTSLEGGSNDFLRARVLWDSADEDGGWNVGLSTDRDSGYRADSGYEQARGFWNLRHNTGAGLLTAGISGSWIDQETAGFISGDKDIYKDPAINRSNPFPEAYRQAESLRAQLSWQPNSSGPWSINNTGYVRWSEMNFLMHFLPGQPVEKNGQVSAGYMLFGQRNSIWNSLLSTGVDLELASGYLEPQASRPAVRLCCMELHGSALRAPASAASRATDWHRRTASRVYALRLQQQYAER